MEPCSCFNMTPFVCRPQWRLAVLVVVASSLGATLASHADADAKQCIDQHQEAQSLRKQGKLLGAKEKLVACADPACPKVIREDCQALLTTVDANIPTVVFGATDSKGNDLSDVKVYVDGTKIADKLEGRAVAVDPGEHRVRFEPAKGQAVERALVAREGEKNRTIRIEIGAVAAAPSGASAASGAVPAPTLAPVSTSEAPGKSSPMLAYVIGGVGVLALGSFTYFAIKGRQEQSDLQNGCAPYCQQSDADSMHRKYLIADICLGVGVASLGVATYLLIRHASRGSAETPSSRVAVDVAAARDGAGLSLRGRF